MFDLYNIKYKKLFVPKIVSNTYFVIKNNLTDIKVFHTKFYFPGTTATHY